MRFSYLFSKIDRLQKTWIPEGTLEYKHFKHITQENDFLARFLCDKFPLKDGELMLDVGGREGDIAIKLQKPEFIHIVDPDPTLRLPFEPSLYLKEKIQDIELSDFRYKLIICSHVLGYLGNQKVQDKVFFKLLKLLAPGGSLVLFYNTNEGYMGDLLEFSSEKLLHGHHDYFNEDLLTKVDEAKFSVSPESTNVSFKLDYDSFEDLAKCCWFLFGAMDQNISKVASIFLPKLKSALKAPTFNIDERIIYITRKV